MTRAEVDAALKRTITAAAEARDDVFAGQNVRTLGSCAAMLALIVGEQEQRLRRLEDAWANEHGGRKP